jgi:membrane fusion protein, copper/silver efflux system
MNKPAAVGSLVVIALGAFLAGRYSGGSKPQPQAKRILYYVDPMHPAYKSDKPGTAPDCGMALEPVYEGQEPTKAQLPANAVLISADKQQLIGVQVEAVEKNSGSRLVRTTGRVVPDDNRVYRLMAGTDGWIVSLQDNPIGSVVKKDQSLAKFYSREFRNAQQAYLGSLASIDRLKSTSRDADENNRVSDSSIRVNEEQLRTLGMGEPQIKELAKTRQVTGDIEVVSPADGIVLSRAISPQQRFEKGTEFYRIGDLSKVWILADLFSDEAQALRPGAKVAVKVREMGKTVYATVSDAPPLFDPTSRTLKLRLEADNPGMLLRPDMFVDVEFHTPAPAGISVPAQAVLDSGMQKIVYVETSDGVFEPRTVELGTSFGNRVAVKHGLAAGDKVVISGNFLIDSESRMKPAVLQSVNQKRDAAMPKDSNAHEMSMAQDPVCGMSLDRSKALTAGHSENYNNETFVFCSDKCQRKFKDDPAKYAESRVRSAAVSGPRRQDD